MLTGAVHLLALLIALAPRGEAMQPPQPTLTTFNLPSPDPPAELPAKTVQPRKVPPLPPQLVEVPPPLLELARLPEMVMALLEQADAQSADGACDLTPPIQAALRISPEVHRDLPTIPARRRSVASTIALWNQIWVVADEDLSQRALDSIRTTVTTTIAAASNSCRLQSQRGPRLIYLPGETDTVLALGSGEWTWQQVADSAEPLSDVRGEPALLNAVTSVESKQRSSATIGILQ